MKDCRLFGVSVALGTREELYRRILSLFESGGTVATVNATMLEYARTHKDFRDTLCSMSLCIPDGKGVSRAFLKMGEYTDVLPGVELGLLLLCSRPYLRLALYGGKRAVGERAAQAILSLCPTVDIVYVRDGYRHTPFEVARDLSLQEVDLVYVCLGSPRQEEVARMLSQVLPKAVVIGLGGSFDVWCGDITRAPEKIRDAGLEWLYRMLKEPRRLAKLPALFSFEMHSFLERLRTKSTKNYRKSEM